MKELIKITSENGKQLVSARELHEFLEVKSKFTTWFNRMCEYGFEENVDYVIPKNGTLENTGFEGLGTPKVDYAITTSMAKELSMIQRTEKGKQARLYFIECEKRALSISEKDKLLLGLFSNNKLTVAESHKQLVELEVSEAVKPLNDKIQIDAPKVTFAETVLKSSDNILIRELAKISSDTGLKIGQNKLYEKLREWKYIFKNSTEPYQSAIDKGFFVIKETTSKTPYGVKINKTTMVTPLGQIKIIEKLRKELA